MPIFAEIARPLHDWTRKNTIFDWTAESEQGIEELKHPLTTAPILANPRHEGKFMFDMDTSNFILGAVLQQEQEGKFRVIASASQALSDAEKRYCITVKELLGAFLV